jgi:hypothetical protein
LIAIGFLSSYLTGIASLFTGVTGTYFLPPTVTETGSLKIIYSNP